jgi:hypothetical protein
LSAGRRGSEMKNNTHSEIVIKMRHIDNAVALFNSLKKVKKIIGCGGDVELLIKTNGKVVSTGYIGHDVYIRKVAHTIYA